MLTEAQKDVKIAYLEQENNRLRGRFWIIRLWLVILILKEGMGGLTHGLYTCVQGRWCYLGTSHK